MFLSRFQTQALMSRSHLQKNEGAKPYPWVRILESGNFRSKFRIIRINNVLFFLYVS